MKMLVLQSSDAGEYKCVATNDAGTSEGVAMLTVRGNDLTLTCIVVLNLKSQVNFESQEKVLLNSVCAKQSQSD